MKPFKLLIDPVDLNQQVSLPAPWPQLSAIGFHEDLLLRAKGYFLQARRLGMEEQATVFLEHAGNSFIKPFNRTKFVIAGNDPQVEVKHKALDALTELSEQFGDRVPAIVWDTLAFLATRRNSDHYSTILASKDELPFGWWLADTVLHGLGKVYGLKMHVDSVFFAHTGMILEHNCDCGCDIHPGGIDEKVCARLPAQRIQLATAALFSHLAGEFLLITGLKMPFEMGLSPEAAEVMALEI